MPRKQPKYINLGGYIRVPQSADGSEFSQCVQQGASLYRQFNQFESDHIVRVDYSRLIPPVVVELGELLGLIYRSDKWHPGQPRVYIHRMQNPPCLVCNIQGTQLYIIGGSYRVTERGIEG